jgi:thiol-disulfide isomerase/thioredoxin
VKRILTALLFTCLTGLVLAGFFFRDSLSNYISNYIVPKTETVAYNPDSVFIDSAYNYNKNGQAYQLTWLEFGSTHCRDCILMEEVMDSVKSAYAGQVRVVFYNVSHEKNKRISLHFGIKMIPVQVLLDKSGKECFRHTGYLSFTDLSKEFHSFGISKTIE